MAFYQDTNNNNEMMLFEEWKNWDSLENYIKSNDYRNILELMELSSVPPEIRFHSVAESKGIEVIERMRA
jgi:quinol monooxygenase YgiN